MLQIILADSELELIPDELWNHPAILKHSRKRSKKPKDMMLDATYHHSALKGEDKKRRGRPDIVHIFLLLTQDSLLNHMDNLQVWIHTRGDNLIWVNPKTRPPKNYNRFIGLFEELFRVGFVPNKANPLFILDSGVEYKDAVKRIEKLSNSHGKGLKKVVLAYNQKQVELYDYFNDFLKISSKNDELLLTIGGFPHGDFRSPVYEISEDIISISNEVLSVWTVTSEILSTYRLALMKNSN